MRTDAEGPRRTCDPPQTNRGMGTVMNSKQSLTYVATTQRCGRRRFVETTSGEAENGEQTTRANYKHKTRIINQQAHETGTVEADEKS
ncbi:hypothetical protein R1flu_023535 [Riccia fluitans]|uniref:Uncharacterized protein n=1 Tax=Riccia fluitans TaxID=41844 RepID=A0ABD1XSB2_9MARC